MKALFYRKCTNSDEYMKLSTYYSDYGQLLDFNIIETFMLRPDDYKEFCSDFLAYRNYISIRKEILTMDNNDIVRCLFVTCNNKDGYLVYPSGYDYARYVAFYKKGSSYRQYEHNKK